MSFNTDEFNEKAKRFTTEYADAKANLEKCLESRKNEDINFICGEQRSKYLFGISQIFCKVEYDLTVRCQKDAQERWASVCFQENVKFGQCTDAALRRLYIYGLEHNPRNPETQ